MVFIFLFVMYDDEYNWKAKGCHCKIKEIDGGFGTYG